MLKSKTTRENWFEEHPIYMEIKSYGYHYQDESRLRTATLVYLDLIEVKHWFDVNLHRCDALGCVFIVGRPLKKCQIELVVPITSLNSLSHEDVQRTILEVCKEFEDPVISEAEISCDKNRKNVNFAITESNSTIVYYKMTNGLVEPDEVGDDDPDADLKIRWKKKSKNN